MSSIETRDYFAAHAPDVPNSFQPEELDQERRLINWRWHYADEMLKARARNKAEGSGGEEKSFWE